MMNIKIIFLDIILAFRTNQTANQLAECGINNFCLKICLEEKCLNEISLSNH